MPIIDPHWILELDNVCRAYPHCCIKKARSETPTQQPPMKWQHRHISMRHILQTSWRKLPTQLKQSKTKCNCPYKCQRQSTNERNLKNELHQFPQFPHKDTMSVASPFPNRPRRSIFSHYIESKKPTSTLKRMFCAHLHSKNMTRLLLHHGSPINCGNRSVSNRVPPPPKIVQHI